MWLTLFQLVISQAKRLWTFVGNPNVLLFVAGLAAAYFINGYVERGKEIDTLENRLDSALAAVKIQQESLRDQAKRDQKFEELLTEFKKGRTDAESVEWAAQPVPSGESERLRTLQDSLNSGESP